MTDPAAELSATLAAMQAPVGDDPDAHALCRFPARRQWLVERLAHRFAGSGPGISAAPKCPRFDEWTRSDSVTSISIVLATGYLGNPASYYGHTLLKFNYRDEGRRTFLQDVSVNYGAILTGDDDPLTYMVKGVVGGYDGGFSHIHYYFHNHNYGENELRDLWEYRLNLPPEDVRRVVAHAWEVLGQRYVYYFFRRNCAYRMAEILGVADSLDIVPPNRPWTIPQAVLQRLAASRNAGDEPLVAEVIYHPSRQSRFYQALAELDGQESALFKDVVNEGGVIDRRRLEDLPERGQHAVLDTLIDYYQFVAEPGERATGKVHPGYAAALAARYRLPPGAPPARAESPPSPDRGRPPGWWQAGWLDRSGQRPLPFLRIRPAYYDPLDADAGHVANSALAMGDLQVFVENGRLRLRRLDLLSIESAGPGISGLPGDRGAAWKIKVGAEPARLFCDRCVTPRLQGDMGVGRRIGEQAYIAVHGGGVLQASRAAQGVAFLRASTAMHVRVDPRTTMLVGAEWRAPVAATVKPYAVHHAEIRFAIGMAGDLRLRYEHDRLGLGSIGLGYYW